MLKRGLGVALLLALCVPSVVAQDGEGKISIHISDTLRNIIPMLREEHGLAIHLMTDDLADKFVRLDLQNATALEVVTAICKQSGAVYQHRTHGVWVPGDDDKGWWSLYLGDWDADCRPRVRVEDYTVYVERVEKHRSKHLQFRWGLDQPEAEKRDNLRIGLSIKPHSDEAAVRLAGLLREGSALTPEGEVVYTAYRIDTDSPCAMDIWTDPDIVHLDFPLPPVPTEQFKELRGRLVLFSSVIPAHCEFTLEEIGATKALGEVECKLLKWEQVSYETAITVERPGWLDTGRPTLPADLVGADGERARSRGTSAHGNMQKWVVTYKFSTPDWAVERVVIEGWLKRSPDKFADFTIKEIPLP